MSMRAAALLLLAAPLFALDLAAAREAYSREDLAKALEIARPLAERGDAEAQAFVGDLFWDGRGIGRDRAKAVAWYVKAAGNGRIEAMVKLSQAFSAGDGVKRDPKRAVRYASAAAGKGSARAMGLLGRYYLRGEGVDQETAKGRAWLEKGAKLGDGYSSFLLGDLVGGKRALAYFQRAGDAGYLAGYTRVGDAFYSGTVVDRDYVAAVGWYRKAAERGEATAQRQLAVCYINGQGVGRDMARARDYLRSAVVGGDPQASDLLAGLSRPIRGRITDIRRGGDRLTLIRIDKGTADGVRKKAQGKIAGIRGKLRITRVWLRSSEAEIKVPPNSVRTASPQVSIER